MNSENFKISLITPVYNAVNYLDNVFKSVQNQTIGFENIEWILVDDCSTDDSFKIINGWADRYSNIKVLQTDANTGTPAEPRNIGLDNATTPYVMFLDNDDELFPYAVELLYSEIDNYDVDIVTGDVALIDSKQFSRGESKKLLNYSPNWEAGYHEMVHPLGDWIMPYLNNHWSKIYKREIIDANKIRSLKGELWEDILFIFQYMTYVKSMIYIKKPIIQYRVRRESLSHVLDVKFYCSLPKSIDYGMEKMIAIGGQHPFDYVELMDRGGHVEFYIDNLLNCENLSKDDLAKCLLAWKQPLVRTPLYGGHFHSAYAKILSDDFTLGDDEKAVSHFFALKELYKQRQTELNNIFSSNSYRFAKKLSDFKEKITGKK